MSLGLATNAAMGGLRITTLGTRLVAENLANADVEGYGVRNLVPTSLLVNGRDLPVQRAVNPVLLGAARSADSMRLHAEIRQTAIAELERAYGVPGDPGSLNSLVAALDSSLHQAVSTPDSDAALQAVAQNASHLVTRFNTLEKTAQSIRQNADDAVAADVAKLNTALDQVVALNIEIQRQSLLGGNPHGLMDERQRVTSDISAIIPITEIPRDNGRIMLLSADGQVLADQTRAEFGFTPTIGITAGDSVANGALSPVSLNGRALAPASPVLASGGLGGHLAVRDEIAPRAQAQLDTLARDLLNRFSGPSADQSLAPGEFGLFALDGTTTLPSMPDGLAGQLRLNAQIDPQAGTGLWRLRAGLNAPSPGPILDATGLARLSAALSGATTLQPGTPSRSFTEHIATQVSALATARLDADSTLTFANAKHATLHEDLAAQGVDTDREMQNLLTLERAYSANARVLSAIDEMMRNLLEI
ncbi:MAG: flagellar hook-associated protein 1 FlgK [Roseibaca calidilacus]|uniref:Flagellar hook-associated protein 1 n=1 Tax=Roseibaca calidilacus TaxID=1666912 RepID=A0A0P7YJ78_9RHOB|nr:flagellar hook-associated protein FlgK [Roseibaca calidilacus]KPP90750.1 MAG: flagellar hook-associated protein 1 FlgK [Roseibaca calidilacus]CUX83497.1 flagellar hook-associated protein 1 FlgK [Roseibaca calidilacus]